jgi:anti-anti-sigma regulatory factor
MQQNTTDNWPHVTVALHDTTLRRDLLLLRARLAETLPRGPAQVVVDLSDLDRISSTTIAALLWTRRCCDTGGLAFALRGSDSRHHDMLQRSGLISPRTLGAAT